MAVAKAISANDQIEGLAAVASGEPKKAAQLYDPRQRTVHIPTPDGTAEMVNINARFLYHGGVGGSGNWEH